MSQLQDRIARERQSYEGDIRDQSRRLHRRFMHVFYCPNSLFGERQREKFIGQRAKGAQVLEVGCGAASTLETLLERGPKRLVGIDLSRKEIERARTRLGSRAHFAVMDAHRLCFPDASFDLVVGRSILHHLEYKVALREVSRVLKSGGAAAFVEPLADNPAAKIYQAFTSRAHTPDEWPLSRKQIRWADCLFEESDHVFCGFFSTALAIATSLVTKNSANVILRAADRADRTLAFTPARYWMRCAYLHWTK